MKILNKEQQEAREQALEKSVLSFNEIEKMMILAGKKPFMKNFLDGDEQDFISNFYKVTCSYNSKNNYFIGKLK